jgi:hypothetical protein
MTGFGAVWGVYSGAGSGWTPELASNELDG